MIIYKDTINNFISDCNNNEISTKIIYSLKQKRGLLDIGISPKERESWNTLKEVAKYLKELNNKEYQYILLEFVIRDSRKRIDVMVVGKDSKNRKNIAIVELKGWSNISLKDNSELLYPNVSYGPCDHPSYEAYDYMYLLNNMYDDINNFNLYPLSFLPNYLYKDKNVLLDKRFNDITSICKSYCKNDANKLIDFLKEYFSGCIDVEDVNKLDDLKYNPSKSFMEHLKEEFLEVRLIGSQSETFKKILYYIDLIKQNNKKTLFIISGGAGSGKTVVAFKLMVYLRSIGSKSFLLLPGPEFRDAIKKMFGEKTASEFIRGADYKIKCDYAIVDEAHKATGRDDAKTFYNKLLDNIGSGLITLIDDQQVINKKGITKEQLKDIANSKGYQICEFELQEQFRNGGDVAYTDWLKNLLLKKNNGQETYLNKFYDFAILDEQEFNQRYKKMYDEFNVRLVSFWTQTWNLNSLEPTVKIGNSMYTWNPNWQWLAKYNKNGNKIAKELNKLCNILNFNKDKKGYQYIGYFNTVQGYEFDYIFVHIPKLFFLNDKNEIDVNLDELYMREMSSQVWSLKVTKSKEEYDEKLKLNKLYFLNRLFVNLTRGTKGTYIYVEDKKIEEYIKSRFINVRSN